MRALATEMAIAWLVSPMNPMEASTALRTSRTARALIAVGLHCLNTIAPAGCARTQLILAHHITTEQTALFPKQVPARCQHAHPCSGMIASAIMQGRQRGLAAFEPAANARAGLHDVWSTECCMTISLRCPSFFPLGKTVWKEGRKECTVHRIAAECGLGLHSRLR